MRNISVTMNGLSGPFGLLAKIKHFLSRILFVAISITSLILVINPTNEVSFQWVYQLCEGLSLKTFFASIFNYQGLMHTLNNPPIMMGIILILLVTFSGYLHVLLIDLLNYAGWANIYYFDKTKGKDKRSNNFEKVLCSTANYLKEVIVFLTAIGIYFCLSGGFAMLTTIVVLKMTFYGLIVLGRHGIIIEKMMRSLHLWHQVPAVPHVDDVKK